MNPFPNILHSLALLLVVPFASAAVPRDALPLDAPELPASYRLHVEFSAPAAGVVRLGKDFAVPLPKGAQHDVAVERPAKGAPVVRVWTDGQAVDVKPAGAAAAATAFPDAKVNLGADFTAAVKFEAQGGGTLFSKCSPAGKWAPDAKALLLRNGRLEYVVEGIGAISGGAKLNNGKPHTAVLTVRAGAAQLWIDGKMVGENPQLTKPDGAADVLKIGGATADFGGDFTEGKIAGVRVWARALPTEEIALLFKDEGAGANTPDFTHTAGGGARPVIEPAAGATVKTAWVQALERSDHRDIVAGWNAKSLAEGAQIYGTLCVVCHGTMAVGVGTAPDLRGSAIPASSEAFRAIVHDGALTENGMPQFSQIGDAELDAIRHYLRHRAKEMAEGK